MLFVEMHDEIVEVIPADVRSLTFCSFGNLLYGALGSTSSARGCLSCPLLLAPPTWTGLGSGAAVGRTLLLGPDPWIENRFGYSLRNETILPAFAGPYTSVVS